MPLAVSEFVHRWKINSQSERSTAQSHFIDLCEMLGEPHPAAGDSAGERYAFEKHVARTKGGKGYADVWLRDHFAWEYKGKHKDLRKAYEQLNDYREALGNPPLLVVCDMDRFEVHTNFTSTSKRVYAFDLGDLNRNQVTAACPLPPLDVLRALFGDVSVLRPERTDAQVTQEAAKLFSRLAERLELEERNLGATREQIAHFLMRLLFCLFADSIGLLPNRVFRNIIQSQDRFLPRKFLRKLTALFEAMSQPDGIFGEHTIKYFNGGLFDNTSTIPLDLADLGILYEVSKNYDWSHIAPAIFGTLFERSLDPKRRSLIGAHYTSEADILLLIEPVLMRPLERRWDEVRRHVLEALEVERAQDAAENGRQARLKTDRESERRLAAWIDELTAVRVLDPACGSGNFLYVALRRMLDIWLEATRFAADEGISIVLPKMVSPAQLFGIETEFYAHELASIVVWIGFLQWKHEHGVIEDREPILQKLDNIQHGDAIMRHDADGKPYEPEWPKADFIIGNPPFLGGKLLRRELKDRYVDDLFVLYEGRVKAESDLVVYWFEKARKQIAEGLAKRAGLLATQSIRGGSNRDVLERIQQSANIFWAWSDRKWLLEGAAVHVSMIGFDDGTEQTRALDGEPVAEINPDLSTGANTTQALALKENVNLCYMGVTRIGQFILESVTAEKMLRQPRNVNGRHNSDVVKPWINAIDLTRRPRGKFIIDFGTDMSMKDAAQYQLPFEYVKQYVLPERANNRRETYRARWWLLGEPRAAMRKALMGLSRYIATPMVSKFRVFVWTAAETIPENLINVIAREDDYFFGVLHSKPHETWGLSQGTQLEDRPRYTPNSTFDTFPFPWPPGKEPAEDQELRVKAIADAARELVRLRDTWLNPPGASESELKTRTLTKLYNKPPTFIENAHNALDEAVFAAYGWPSDLPKQEILARLLALNHERAAAAKGN